MHIFAGLLMLVLGVGMLAIAIQGVRRGWLPNGPNGFRKGRGVFRHENPLGFWFFFVLYVAVGIQGTLYALRVLSGQVPM